MRSTLIAVVFLLINNATLIRADHVVGDMILTDEQHDEIMLRPSGVGHVKTDEGRQRRNAIRDERRRWPGGVIPYRFDDSFSDSDKAKVRKAMDIWEKYTCLSFRLADYNDLKHYNYWIEPDVVEFKNGTGCYSHVGWWSESESLTQHVISLEQSGSGDCRSVDTILHELGHTIGMFHTHNRWDRDEYIELDLSDVDDELKFVFRKLSQEVAHHYGVQYDYRSIMHYEKESYGGVIYTKDPKFQNIIGQGKTLSFGDIEMVNKMYQCKPRYCPLSDFECRGFVDASCTCVCPGPNDCQLTQPCVTGKGTAT